ncbi:TonB family protein [Bradyrhizobium sp. AUGA SZCCT0222]|uniref:energy transducer TonB n=1 Tax=Bradyrhizobium sp. AUGA SZCCT0222 TaxID=2807668 RepID=UPI002012EEE6|nr:TonB family protein [Bradyrhizobium sp. AUGA SZCCT0222]
MRLGFVIFLMGAAMPGYAAQIDVLKRWKSEVRNRLNTNTRFPPEAQGQTGAVTVGFVLDRSGKLVSSWLRESTGIPALDAEALALIDRAQPFPAPPPKAADSQFKFGIQFFFTNGPHPDLVKEEATINAKMRSICRGC